MGQNKIWNLISLVEKIKEAKKNHKLKSEAYHLLKLNPNDWFSIEEIKQGIVKLRNTNTPCDEKDISSIIEQLNSMKFYNIMMIFPLGTIKVYILNFFYFSIFSIFSIFNFHCEHNPKF